LFGCGYAYPSVNERKRQAPSLPFLLFMTGFKHSKKNYAFIAVSGPRQGMFLYDIPADFGELKKGQRVLVPFGKIKKIGYYIGPGKPSGSFKVKSVIRLIDTESYFTEDLFTMCIWIAEYYCANPADCLSAALPPILKSKIMPNYYWNINNETLTGKLTRLFKSEKKVSASALKEIEGYKKELLKKLIEENVIIEKPFEYNIPESPKNKLYRSLNSEKWEDYFKNKKINPVPFEGALRRNVLLAQDWTDHYIKSAVDDEILEVSNEVRSFIPADVIKPRADLDQIVLNDEQSFVVNEITNKINEACFQPFLLHGVTGSGKTIVYCHLAQKTVDQNKTVLILTPEIALTGATLAYFKGFFDKAVTVIHSGMSHQERMESFNGIRDGKYKIVIGPRSALFASLPNLGLIIVDEEHDSSYKQSDPSPRFQGRDCAIMRAKLNNIPVVLGSATPSVESYYQTLNEKYKLLKLTKRPAGATLPTVRIIDMKSAGLKGDLQYFSYPLKKEIDARLNNNEQVILFLNRRGYSPQLKCSACGDVPGCPNCQVKLNYHRTGRKLTCHYCGYTTFSKEVCDKCGGRDFLYHGAGTQKVEEAIPRLFDGTTPLRLDSDSAAGRLKLGKILQSFASGESNILLGTQMVTKGLDMPGVTLVGVLSADMLLDMPDFRSSERTFSQILQVAGRSGRADKPGEVLIQTYYPENDLITNAANQDYNAFFDKEIESRKELFYPPYSRLVNFIFSSTNEEKLEREALKFRNLIQQKLTDTNISASVLGPAPCALYFLRKKFRRNLLLKTRQVMKVSWLIKEWERENKNFELSSIIKVVIDIDPDNMM